jgi:hypothetical protein
MVLAQDATKSADAAEFLARARRASGYRIEAVQSYSRAIELSETPRASCCTRTRSVRFLRLKSAK